MFHYSYFFYPTIFFSIIVTSVNSATFYYNSGSFKGNNKILGYGTNEVLASGSYVGTDGTDEARVIYYWGNNGNNNT